MTLLSFLTGGGRKTGAGLTPVRRRPTFDLSLTGLVYLTLMMFMALAAINTQASLLFGVFGLMIGVLLVSISISRVILKKVRVRRDLPEAGTVGEPLNVRYHFTNAKRFWPTLSVSLAELDGVEGFARQPQAYLLHAGAGQESSVPVVYLPKRRGVHHLGRFQLSTSFPFGFVKRAVERTQADAVAVYPPCARVDDRVMALCQPAETSGSTLRPRRGGSDELYGLKDFQRGESPRLIYWKRSARTGVLVSKEMTQVSPPRLLLLVDTRLADRTRASHALVEEAIAMAASVATAGLEQGLSVGAFAYVGPGGGGGGAAGEQWHGVAPTRGKRQRRDVLTLLARLPANPTYGPQDLLDRCRDLLEVGTTAVLITPQPLEAGVNDALRGTLVVLVAGTAQARTWFKFPPETAFDRTCPPDQEAGIKSQ